VLIFVAFPGKVKKIRCFNSETISRKCIDLSFKLITGVGDGGGAGGTYLPKNRKNIFSVNYYVKFGHFVWQISCKIREFLLIFQADIKMRVF